ncbi:MAG TPA: ribosome-associated translation inhibitor RaiA [Candidatus Dormibacteraeota bacterium]
MSPGAGAGGEAAASRVSITVRQPLPPNLHDYARTKVSRLTRHTSLHDVNVIIDHDIHSHRLSRVEVVAHLHHVRIAAQAQAPTLPEAIDLAVDRADRQVMRRKDRVTDHKGRVGADGLTAAERSPTTESS